MRALIYKRTHCGDPAEEPVEFDENDCTGRIGRRSGVARVLRFGVNNCMGRVRSYNYDYVIGIGGNGKEPREEGIAGKLTWIGRRPHKTQSISTTENSGVLVEFKYKDFRLYDKKGPPIKDVASLLAKRLLKKHGPRYFINLTKAESNQVKELVERALDNGEFDAPPPDAPKRGGSPRHPCR